MKFRVCVLLLSNFLFEYQLTLSQCEGCSRVGTSGSYNNGTNTCWDLVPFKIYGCRGEWSVPGMYSTGINSVSQLCSSNYDVCKSTSEAENLGLTISTCGSIDSLEFFGSKQSTDGGWACSINGTNDVMGCSSDSIDNIVDNGLNCNNIFNAGLSSFYTSWSNNAWSFEGTDSKTELNGVILSNEKYGGVLCCKTSTSPTVIPSNLPTMTTNYPTNDPTNIPSNSPSNDPTNAPSNGPTNAPSNGPTKIPSNSPSNVPSNTQSAYIPQIQSTLGIHSSSTNIGNDDSFTESNENELNESVMISITAAIIVVCFIIICYCTFECKNNQKKQKNNQNDQIPDKNQQNAKGKEKEPKTKQTPNEVDMTIILNNLIPNEHTNNMKDGYVGEPDDKIETTNDDVIVFEKDIKINTFGEKSISDDIMIEVEGLDLKNNKNGNGMDDTCTNK